MRLDERILFIDGEAMVIDKPAGMPVDASRDGALAVANHLDLLRFGFERQPQPVHRLDRDTSGCLLLARNPKAQRRFSASFEAGAVTKTYYAIVEGVAPAPDGEVVLALAKVSSAEAGWRIVPSPNGKPARTAWTCLAQADGRSLLRLRPRTGRTHQLRVHLSAGLGLPIVGDPVYGRAGGAMMLHAGGLHLPRDGKPAVAATAPWPQRFEAIGFAGPDVAADAPA